MNHTHKWHLVCNTKAYYTVRCKCGKRIVIRKDHIWPDNCKHKFVAGCSYGLYGEPLTIETVCIKCSAHEKFPVEYKNFCRKIRWDIEKFKRGIHHMFKVSRTTDRTQADT